MPSPYFQLNYNTKAPEINLIEDLINEAIYIQGFSAYIIPRNGTIDLLYGDEPLAKFDEYYKVDTYLVNSDYGDTNDFFTKFGLEVRNNITVQIAVKEFMKKTSNKFSRIDEGWLLYVPFLRNTGEIFEIKFVNTTKDLNVLARAKPYFYELSLEPYKFDNSDSINTGLDILDNIEEDNSLELILKLTSGSGDFITNETIYQGTANSHIGTGIVYKWDSANTTLKVINYNGNFSNTSLLTVIGNTSGATYSLFNENDRYENTQFDNDVIHDEALNFIHTDDNPFGGLSQY